MNWIKPVTLRGKHITLAPLSMEHCTDLIESVKDGELWKLWYATVPSPDGMTTEVLHRLALQEKGAMVPWTVIDNKTNHAIGMTTYYSISEMDKRLGIGWTWYRKTSQKTAVNTECKLLLLTHAFETVKCVAVAFGANFYNKNSQRAIERIGAKFDGTIRNLRIMPNGVVCDFCMYSIINSEWLAVKTNLETKLAQNHAKYRRSKKTLGFVLPDR